MNNPAYIPLGDLVVGHCYVVESRNIHCGIWDGKAFHGIRRKFGDLFMDAEVHYDLDDNHGTARAVKEMT